MARLAISNIGWTDEEELSIAKLLQSYGVTAVEIAPTKRWHDPTDAPLTDAIAYRDWWRQFNIEVVAFQSMLFNRPDLTIFDNPQLRSQTLEYMGKFIQLAGSMGAKRLVFGSPKNRQRGQMGLLEADKIAIDFFSILGSIAEDNDVVLCIEPNAPQYGCDYVTTASEGASLVRSVGSRGFGLHLDTACMALAGDDLYESIIQNSELLRHFHVSAPMLDRVLDRNDVDYSSAARALKDSEYDQVVSIEMRPGDQGANLKRVEDALIFVKSTFGID